MSCLERDPREYSDLLRRAIAARPDGPVDWLARVACDLDAGTPRPDGETERAVLVARLILEEIS